MTPSARSQANSLRQAQRRADCMRAMGGKCATCGSQSQLEFDHIDPSTKITHNFWGWTLKRLETELAKCQLLCVDCHREKTRIERGFTKRKHGTQVMYQKGGCRCAQCRTENARIERKRRLLKRVTLSCPPLPQAPAPF